MTGLSLHVDKDGNHHPSSSSSHTHSQPSQGNNNNNNNTTTNAQPGDITAGGVGGGGGGGGTNTGNKTKAQQRLEMSQALLGLGEASDKAGHHGVKATGPMSSGLRRAVAAARSVAASDGGSTATKIADDRSIVSGNSSKHSGSTGDSSGDSLDSNSTTMTNRNVSSFLREATENARERLSRARKIAILCTIIALGGWIGLYVIASTGFESVHQSLELLGLACYRRHLASSMVTTVGALELCQHNIWPKTMFNETRERFVDEIAVFQALESHLYDESAMTPQVKAFVYNPNIVMKRNIGAIEVVSVMNLREMSQLFSSACLKVLSTPVEGLTRTLTALYDIMVNGFTSVEDAYRDVAHVIALELESGYKNVWTLELVIHLITFICILLYLIIELRPVFIATETASEHVVLLFLGLPRAIVKVLQKRFLVALRNQGEEEDEEVALSNTSAESSRRGLGLDMADDLSDSTENTSVSGTSDGKSSDTSSYNSDGAKSGSNVLSMRNVSASRQQALRDLICKKRCTVLTRLLVYVAIFIIYIIVEVVMTSNTHNSTSKYADDMEASTFRQTIVAQLRHHLRERLIGTTPELDAKVEDLFRKVNTYNRAVLFGDSELQLTGKSDAAQIRYQFDSPCEPLNMIAIPESVRVRFNAECATYRFGMNERGAQETFYSTTLVARQLGSKRYANAWLAALNGVNPANITIPLYSEQFNSSVTIDDELRDISISFLEPMMSRSTELYKEAANRSIDSYNTFRLWFLIGCVIGLVLYHALVINPIFKELHDLFRNCASMFLMFPPDVVMKVPQVSNFLAEASKRAAEGELEYLASMKKKSSGQSHNDTPKVQT